MTYFLAPRLDNNNNPFAENHDPDAVHMSNGTQVRYLSTATAQVYQNQNNSEERSAGESGSNGTGTGPKYNDDDILFERPVNVLREAARSITRAQRAELEELEQFATSFKKARIKYGFTQLDIGNALGRRYGADFSQTTISRFEAGNLSYKNMCKLRPLVEEWMRDVEICFARGMSLQQIICMGLENQMGLGGALSGTPRGPPVPVKKRRKRTSLDQQQHKVLEVVFKMNPRPTNEQVAELADQIQLNKEVVRVWFCNRRQKMRRCNEVFEPMTFAAGAEVVGQQTMDRMM